MNEGLKDKYRKTLIDILSANPKVERVVLFGSRAMGTFSPTSDIDLALYGDELTLTDLARLKAEIEETHIPQQVDLVAVKDIDNEKLLAHIRKYGVEWFSRKEGEERSNSMESKWNCLPFTEALEINPQVSLKRGEIYPFVDMKAVEASRRGASESEFREFKGSGARFMPLDTLMARITPCLENGKIARYTPSSDVNGPAFGSTEFIVIRGREGVTDNDYAYYLTKWEDFRQFAVSQMTGSSGRQRVPVDSLAKFMVPVPENLDEQRAIAHILGSLDDKIELNRQMNKTLEAMAQALFKSWFIDFDPVVVNALKAGNPIPEKFARAAAHYRENPDTLGLPEETLRLFPDRFQDSELGPIPEGWDITKVEDIAEKVACGPFGSSIKVSTFVSEGIPVISGQHLNGIRLADGEYNFITPDHADKLKNANVYRGDVVFTHAGNIGQVSFIPKTSRFSRYVLSQRQFYLRCNREVVSEIYMAHYFKSPVGQHALLANTSSTGVPSISRPVSYLKSIQFCLPAKLIIDESDRHARLLHICWVPCDHIPRRSYPLFRARDVLSELIAEAKAQKVARSQR